MNKEKRLKNYKLIDSLTRKVEEQQIEINQLRDLVDTLKFFINKFDKLDNKSFDSQSESEIAGSVSSKLNNEEGEEEDN